jgi:DNA-binding response OmpR family regulator
MKARILWIEGKRAESPPFITNLRKKDFEIETVLSGTAALSRVVDFDPDLIVVNAASMRTTGKRICRSLHDRADGVPLLLISEQGRYSGDPCVAAELVLPFTIRKLINRIKPLLPSKDTNILHVGPIWLDVERKRVRCQGREATLTPRLVQLLTYFLNHPGDALEREGIFREVWETGYTEDTRTLDVHISWLRKAIEEDPRKPDFLKTIRGVGYRLDL